MNKWGLGENLATNDQNHDKPRACFYKLFILRQYLILSVLQLPSDQQTGVVTIEVRTQNRHSMDDDKIQDTIL